MSALDVLIAGTAASNGAERIISMDSDYHRIARVEDGAAGLFDQKRRGRYESYPHSQILGGGWIMSKGQKTGSMSSFANLLSVIITSSAPISRPVEANHPVSGVLHEADGEGAGSRDHHAEIWVLKSNHQAATPRGFEFKDRRIHES